MTFSSGCSEGMAPPGAGLERAAVVLLRRDLVEVDVLEAADVDRRARLAVRPDTLAERMHAAIRAEAVLDDVAVERVRRHVALGRQQLELLARHEPHDGALALADRAVAGHAALDRAFDAELDAAAVTASVVQHRVTPL